MPLKIELVVDEAFSDEELGRIAAPAVRGGFRPTRWGDCGHRTETAAAA
jgi:hypothetical protein